MLLDAHGALRAGVDLVVGYFETHKRADTLALAEGLETVPRRRIVHRERQFEEMDTEAILRRKPQLCLVDEFAHTNIPGAEREKRWEDVLVVLEAGIHVWTTMNVQHLESLNDAVFEITGIRVRETVPDWVIKQAAEIQFVDATPEALLNRLRRGAVYTGDLAQTAVERFFREASLRALREMAMREAAHEVQTQQAEQRIEHAAPVIEAAAGASTGDLPVAVRERILLLVTADATTAMLIRRARRVADYLNGDCLAVYVDRDGRLNDLPAAEHDQIERHLNFARNLRIETRILPGQNVARTLVDFAHRNHVTQIFLSRALLRSPRGFRPRSAISEIIQLARDIQITVVSTQRVGAGESAAKSQAENRLRPDS